MNILLINHYAGSIKHGMEFRPFYLAREWVRMGHSVTIIASSFSHIRNMQPVINGAAITAEDIDGVRYLWLKTPAYEGNGVRRIINMLSFVGLLFKNRSELAHEGKPDVVIASSTYLLDVYLAKSIAKITGSKLIFEVHDLWPLSLIELGGMSRWHPFIIFMQMAEDYAYRNADRVVSLLPKAQSYMRQHGMKPNKFVYIPNGVLLDEWEKNNLTLPQEHHDVIEKLREKNRFLVGYAGSHGPSNSLDDLIIAANLLKDQSVSFVLVGKGPERMSLMKKVFGMGMKNVTFLPPVPRDAIPPLLKSMDALYIGLKRQPLFRYGISPNKLIDYMMAGKPVIQAIDAGNDMVREAGCGISISSSNPEIVAKAIVELLNMSPLKRCEMGLRGVEYVRSNHDYRVLAMKFLLVMDSI